MRIRNRVGQPPSMAFRRRLAPGGFLPVRAREKINTLSVVHRSVITETTARLRRFGDA